MKRPLREGFLLLRWRTSLLPLMKKTAFTALATAALIITSTSCGKHSWEKTQALHEGMHKGHGEDAHGDAKHNDHAKPAEHGKADAHAAPAAHAPEKKAEAAH